MFGAALWTWILTKPDTEELTLGHPVQEMANVIIPTFHIKKQIMQSSLRAVTQLKVWSQTPGPGLGPSHSESSQRPLTT